MKSISVDKLRQMLNAGEEIQLIDVRELYELKTEGTIKGLLHIPLGEIMERLDELRNDNPVVFYCRIGRRSGNVLKFMKMKGLYMENYYNLDGGINAWKQEFTC